MIELDQRCRPTALLAAAACSLLLGSASAQPADADRHTIAVRVLDDATGEPIEGASFTFHDACDEREVLQTDAEGVAVHSHQGSIPVGVGYVEADDYVRARIRWRPESPRTSIGETPRIDVRLGRGVTYGGRVIDDAGEPIEGATVMLRAASAPVEAPGNAIVESWSQHERPATDADGRWSYDDVPSDAEQISLGAYHLDYASHMGSLSGVYDWDRPESTKALLAGEDVRMLDRGLPVAGRVTDEAGDPVENAEVGLGADRVASNILPPAKTDADGRYRLTARAGEQVTLTFKASGHAPQLHAFTLGSTPAEVDVAMGPPQTLRGTVVDPAGQPIVDAYVFVDGWRDTRTLTATLRTDAEGRFSWDDAPADEVKLDVLANGYADNRGVTATVGGENRITLGQPLVVRGTVVEDATGDPIDAYDVIEGIAREGQPIYWNRRGSDDAPAPDGNAFVRRFTRGSDAVAVRIEASGYLPADSPTWPMSGGEIEHEFRLKPANNVSGTVIGAGGEAMLDAIVFVVGPGDHLSVENGRVESRARYAHTSVDGEGRFELPPRTERVLLLALSEAGYVQTNVEPGTEPGELTLLPWATVSGEVWIGDKPVAGAEVRGWSFGADDAARVPSDPQISWETSAVADADGRFAVDRVPAGNLTVNRQVRTAESWVYTSSEQVDVAPGEHVKVKIGGVGRPVVGRVALPDDLTREGGPRWSSSSSAMMTKLDVSPLPVPDEGMTPDEQEAWWKAWSESDEGKQRMEKLQEAYATQKRYPILVDAEGVFRVEDVQPGDYTVAIQIDRVGARGEWTRDTLAAATTTVTVPPIEGEATYSVEATDVGVVEVAKPEPPTTRP